MDPAPLLDAAAKENRRRRRQVRDVLGARVRRAVGQAVESGTNIDWPRKDSLANYEDDQLRDAHDEGGSIASPV
jgi:hypothetical protein